MDTPKAELFQTNYTSDRITRRSFSLFFCLCCFVFASEALRKPDQLSIGLTIYLHLAIVKN